MPNLLEDRIVHATRMINLAPSIRIGLLTPYSGSNLGDGAIQDAVKSAILQRFPDAYIVLLTADPMNTEYLHGLPSFPMTGIYIPGYSTTIAHTNRKRSELFGRNRNTLRQRVQGNPLANILIGGPFRIAKMFVRSVRHFVREVLHIARSYAIARTLDLIIVSGGGQFDDYWGGAMAHPYTLAKWGWVARIAGCKYIIMSVGVGQLSKKLSRIFSTMALRSAYYRSFRDEGSKNLLSFSGVAQRDRVLPDLAFSYPISRAVSASGWVFREMPLKVGIAPIAYLSKYGWPEENERVFEQYFNALSRFCEWLIERSWRVELFYTDVPDDSVVDRLIGHLNKAVSGSKDIVTVAQFTNAEELVVGLSSFDVVVASRLHAIILSHVLAIPALAISYERKVDAHMADMKQREFSVDIHSANFQAILDSFEQLVKHRTTVSAELKESVALKRGLLDGQYDSVLYCHEEAIVDSFSLSGEEKVQR